MATDRPIPSLSVPALHELRRIYCKHLIEVFATDETKELYERGCIEGRFAAIGPDKRPRAFVVEGLTPTGLAVLEASDRKTA